MYWPPRGSPASHISSARMNEIHGSASRPPQRLGQCGTSKPACREFTAELLRERALHFGARTVRDGFPIARQVRCQKSTDRRPECLLLNIPGEIHQCRSEVKIIGVSSAKPAASVLPREAPQLGEAWAWAAILSDRHPRNALATTRDAGTGVVRIRLTEPVEAGCRDRLRPHRPRARGANRRPPMQAIEGRVLRRTLAHWGNWTASTAGLHIA